MRAKMHAKGASQTKHTLADNPTRVERPENKRALSWEMQLKFTVPRLSVFARYLSWTHWEWFTNRYFVHRNTSCLENPHGIREL